MGKITITKSATRIFSLGSYESYQPNISITEEIEDSKDIQKTIDKLTKIVHDEVSKEAIKVKNKLDK